MTSRRLVAFAVLVLFTEHHEDHHHLGCPTDVQPLPGRALGEELRGRLTSDGAAMAGPSIFFSVEDGNPAQREEGRSVGIIVCIYYM